MAKKDIEAVMKRVAAIKLKTHSEGVDYDGVCAKAMEFLKGHAGNHIPKVKLDSIEKSMKVATGYGETNTASLIDRALIAEGIPYAWDYSPDEPEIFPGKGWLIFGDEVESKKKLSSRRR